jgi:uncharacterized protein with GYD domain
VAKYLIEATYTNTGMKGVLDKGGTARVEAIEKTVADVGGTLESFYFAFGSCDAYVTVDLPDNTTAAAVALAVGATGAASTKTIVLLTAEEIDRATHTQLAYTPPGG